MTPDSIGAPADGLVDRGHSDLIDDLSEPQRAALKGLLSPGEFIVWSGRGQPRPLPPIPVFPAFFAAFLCGTSGFALTVLFGIYGFRQMDLAMIVLLCLAPGALGAIAAVGMAWGWTRHRYWQRRIAGSFYVLTDRRAIVGWARNEAADPRFVCWTAEAFDGTRCIEHGDGIGAVYFLYDGEVVEPSYGFEGIRGAGRVDALIREVLLGEKPLSGSDLEEL